MDGSGWVIVLYNRHIDKIALGEVISGFYWELECENGETIAFMTATPFTFGWERIGTL